MRYNVEDFGARSYLSELLKQEKLDIAKEYVSLCLKCIPTSVIWDRSPELKDYKDWLMEQMNSEKVKKAKVKATGKGKGRPKVKSSNKRLSLNNRLEIAFKVLEGLKWILTRFIIN